MDKQEQVEWNDVNKLLQHHGFKPVYFSDPVENRVHSDLVLLNKSSADDIRTTLTVMLTDSERRQALIQELIQSNNQLKVEVNEHMNRAAQYSQRVTELEGLLDAVRTRVQDLEDRYLNKAVQQHSRTKQLQEEKQEAEKLGLVLEEKLSEKRKEAAQLQRKLYFSIKEEEQRLAQQSRTFQNIFNKVSQHNSPADQQVLDVIDFYETKLTEIMDEIRSAKREPTQSQVADQTRIKKLFSNFTPPLKTILRVHQDQQKESRNQIEELTREVERLKQELDTRPTLKEVKVYKHKLRLLERSSKHSNTRLLKEDSRTEVGENLTDQTRGDSLCAHYHNLMNEISTVVTSPKAPIQLHKLKPASTGNDQTGVGLEFQTILPTLEVWAQQLHLIKDLQRGINKLSARLVSCQPLDGGCNEVEEVKVENMMLLVDTMLENTSADQEKMLRSPTRYTLGSMVSHFQKLFDVNTLSGVYPRMNEVYTKLGEMTNTMRNLRDVLELDSRVTPAEVLYQVVKLVSSTQHNPGFHNLLGDADIDSIIVKVKQHDEFFPAFYCLTLDILNILGVNQLDDILPALKSLKHTAQ